MTCEKQFLPANNIFLYCSEACRLRDQAPGFPSRAHSYTRTATSSPQCTFTGHLSSFQSTYSLDDGPDIVPRFSPTQSRPRSYFNSEPFLPSYQHSSTALHSTSPPTTAWSSSRSSTALASLRELATVLPKIPSRKGSGSEADESPSRSTNISRTSSGVWNYMPFTGSKTATPTPSTTPGNSYTTTSQGYTVSASYGAYGTTSTHGGRKEEYFSAKSHGLGLTGGAAGYGNTGGMGMDRPLPPRNGPGGYGHRPTSIDLVTPYSQGQ